MCRRTRRPIWSVSLIGAILLGLSVSGCTQPWHLGLTERSAQGQRAVVATPSAAGKARTLQSDTFMRSVALRDGELGWRQLCPDLQRVVTESAMRNQADSQKAAEVGRVAKLGIDFVGSRSLRSGTSIRFYVLTADMTDGSASSRVFIVRSRPAGCVEDVQVEDER